MAAKKKTKKATATKTPDVDALSPNSNRGEAVLAACRSAGGTGDAADCIADILALVFIEGCVARGEAAAEGDYFFTPDTMESVCEEAMSAVEVWIEGERRSRNEE